MNSGLFDQDIALTEFQFPAEGRTSEVFTTEVTELHRGSTVSERRVRRGTQGEYRNIFSLRTSASSAFKSFYFPSAIPSVFSVTSVVKLHTSSKADVRMCMRVTVSDDPVKHIYQCRPGREHPWFFKAGRALKMPCWLRGAHCASSHRARIFALELSEQSATVGRH